VIVRAGGDAERPLARAWVCDSLHVNQG
jgi:hypothetical protein